MGLSEESHVMLSLTCLGIGGKGAFPAEPGSLALHPPTSGWGLGGRWSGVWLRVSSGESHKLVEMCWILEVTGR